MNDLEKYLDRVIGQKQPGNVTVSRVPMQIPSPVEPESEPEETTNLGGALLRRWYVILLTIVVICSVGAPCIWLLIKRSYQVTGAIRVDPIISNIITGQTNPGGISNYSDFMATQAMMITSRQVVREVATDLSGKGLQFFEERTNTLPAKIARKLGRKEITPEPEQVLKEAILDELITAGVPRRGEVILVSMEWHNIAEATRIVDSFIRNYMSLEVTSASDREEEQLATLQNEQKLLYNKLEDDRKQIAGMAAEYGSKKLDERYDMNLKRVGMLLNTLTEVQARRIYLQTQVALYGDPNDPNSSAEDVVSPTEWVSLREEYINKDPAVQSRTTNVISLEQSLIIARQELQPSHPRIKEKEELLAELKASLEEHKETARAKFEDLMKKEEANKSARKLEDLKDSLKQVEAHEEKIKSLLAQEDQQTIDLGQKNLAMLTLQDELILTKEMYDTISRRIQEFKMERKRPARIEVAEYANVKNIIDKRPKYTVALVFGALALGAMLAFLKEKADRSLRTPDDVAKRIGLRIIGTTTSTHTVKPARIREQVAGDYQTIRANLGLLDGEGMPRKLVVTSPGMQEGKTTFATNLAISTSKSGKKVLLIDGDLRNPNIASLLGMSKEARGLQEVLLGRPLHEAVHHVNGLDVLAADSANISDAFELLAASVTQQRLDELAQNYDHVIIDTPPVLAFADALIWAKVADGVVLTCFAGQTTGPNLIKAKQRLVQMDANVLGTVLSNVELDDSYQPYGYHYYSRGKRARAEAKRIRKKMLLPMKPPNPKAP
ncbi:MAG: polysaccharide biosynthesis tyrosine autokinase [Planctomycetota bacterium]|jgi:capsular exopolysaccharide synthesis family protein